MKLVILGANGMLGTDLVRTCKFEGIEAISLDLPEFDITDSKQLESRVPEGDWVINCAAYTRVDDAEREIDQAFAVNAEAVEHLASVCNFRGIPLLQISTDYVFDGLSGKPYCEDDPVNPVSIYGKSKLKGEEAVRALSGRYLIVRTQLLFGVNGNNFVKSIGRKLREGDGRLRVVEDQVSAPTYTGHLSGAIVKLVRSGRNGTVHVTASGSCSWHEFACAIAERIRPGAEVLPVTSEEFNRPAARPPYSVLDNSRYLSWTGEAMPSWSDSLDEYLKEPGAL